MGQNDIITVTVAIASYGWAVTIRNGALVSYLSDFSAAEKSERYRLAIIAALRRVRANSAVSLHVPADCGLHGNLA